MYTNTESAASPNSLAQKQNDPQFVHHIAGQDKPMTEAERLAYVNKLIEAKVKVLTEEERLDNAARIHAKATALVESDLRRTPNNPTPEQIKANKEFAAKGMTPERIEAKRRADLETKSWDKEEVEEDPAALDEETRLNRKAEREAKRKHHS
jgi:hypothetical protein